MTFTALDYALIAIAIYSIYVGWWRGLIKSAFAILGVGFGLWLSNSILEIYYGAASDIDSKRIAITTFVFMAGIAVGNIFGSIVGNFVQKLIARGPIKLINKFGGATFSALTWALVVWLISGFLSGLPISRVTNALNDSAVISKLDEVAPDQLRTFVESARASITNSQLPEVAIDAIVGPEVEPPDPAILANKNIATAIASVARIESISEECNTKLSGSGFVIAENLVVTNAHVIAGIDKPNVRIGGKGKAVSGEVVYFDPKIDLALIRTTKLTAPALQLGEDLRRSDMAVVAGFPGGGSLSLIPARVKSVAKSIDSDIYGAGQVTRELYVLRADVKQGDSGAALINDQGKVAGVIFAASATESFVGYALTITELKRALNIGSANTEPVDTGKCLIAP